MRIFQVQPGDRDRFDRFIASFPTGDMLQTWAWGDLKAKSGWKPIRVLAERDGQDVAAASLLVRKLPKVNKSIVYASRGPVLDIRDRELFAAFTRELATISREHGGILLKIDPPVEIEDNESERSILGAGFRPIPLTGFGGTQPKCVMQLDLQRSLDDILASFHQKWRYNIRLAEKKGVTVDEHCGKDRIGDFYRILNETTARDGFRVRSQKYFEDMWDLLSPTGGIKLALAHYEGQPIAGALCFLLGDRAWYTYGASSNQHRNVMPNHLVQWRMIQWAHSQGCRWYDFRGVSPKKGEGDQHLEGLNRFKEGFSPRFVEYLGEFDLVLSPTWTWLWNVGRPRVTRLLRGKPAAEPSE